MHDSYYNFLREPFRLTPDPHLFYPSATHSRGLAYLQYAFHQRDGFVVVTGSAGIGKTELMLNLVSQLPRDHVTLAKLSASQGNTNDLLELLAASLLPSPQAWSKGVLQKRLEDFFIAQAKIKRQVLLLIDDAHNLTLDALIELGGLTNFRVDEKPVLQCFLMGRVSLEQKLDHPKLDQLTQRIIVSLRLQTLNRQETQGYIEHRLKKVNWRGNPAFSERAYSLIHQYSEGIPRRINVLCRRILLDAAEAGKSEIDTRLVNQVICDLQTHAEAPRAKMDLDFADMKQPRTAAEHRPARAIESHMDAAKNNDHHPHPPTSMPRPIVTQPSAVQNISVASDYPRMNSKPLVGEGRAQPLRDTPQFPDPAGGINTLQQPDLAPAQNRFQPKVPDVLKVAKATNVTNAKVKQSVDPKIHLSGKTDGASQQTPDDTTVTGTNMTGEQEYQQWSRAAPATINKTPASAMNPSPITTSPQQRAKTSSQTTAMLAESNAPVTGKPKASIYRQSTTARPSGLLDKELLALASWYDAAQTDSGQPTTTLDTGLAQTRGSEQSANTGMVQTNTLSGDNRHVAECAIAPGEDNNKEWESILHRLSAPIPGWLPLSPVGLGISLLTLSILWWFVYGPGVNTTLRLFSSLADIVARG